MNLTRTTIELMLSQILTQHPGVRIAIDWEEEGSQITTLPGKTLSPRLTLEEMAIWLDGFDAGLSVAETR